METSTLGDHSVLDDDIKYLFLANHMSITYLVAFFTFSINIKFLQCIKTKGLKENTYYIHDIINWSY